MFRKPKKLENLRIKKTLNKPTTSNNSEDEEDEEDDTISRIEDIREAQKLRERHNGMNAVECAVGKQLAKEFTQLAENPFHGGLTENRKLALAAADIENDIKEQFKKETLLRDEHEEMRKYIESKLKRKMFTLSKDDEAAEIVEAAETLNDVKKSKIIDNFEEKIMLKAANKIKNYASKTWDESLSNQMLVGIPEVDLGIDVRMENIIETEKKKLELLQRLQKTKK